MMYQKVRMQAEILQTSCCKFAGVFLLEMMSGFAWVMLASQERMERHF